MGNHPSHPNHPPPPAAQQDQGNPQQGTGGGAYPQAAYPYPYPQQPAATPSGQPQSSTAQTRPPWQPYYSYSAPNYYQYHSGSYPAGYQYPPAAYPGASNAWHPHAPGYPGQQYWYPGMQPAAPGGTPRPPGPAIEHVKEIQTVRNPVLVKRSSVRLERDATDPSKHVLCFTYNATVSGMMAVFFVAREGSGGSFHPVHPDLYTSPAAPFQKGINQQFRQPAEAAVKLSLFPEEQLLAVDTTGGEEVFPVVICMVSHKVQGEKGEAQATASGQGSGSSTPGGASADLLGLDGEGTRGAPVILPGQPLDPSVQAQMTYAVLKRRATPGPKSSPAAGTPQKVGGPGTPVKAPPGGEPVMEYDVRVVKQRIWVDGAEYDLQEIYGLEQTAGAGAKGSSADAARGDSQGAAELARDASTSSDDSGTECVICLSAPRNTTVLPCRHMCMCGECAEVLRFQSNKCPICRHTVEGLLQIKISQRKPSSNDLLNEEQSKSASSNAAKPSLSSQTDSVEWPPVSATGHNSSTGSGSQTLPGPSGAPAPPPAGQAAGPSFLMPS